MEMAGRNSTLLLLFAFVFFILLLQRPVFATKEAYVVYLGEHSRDPDLSPWEASMRATESHHELLASVLKDKEKVEDAIFYSYTHNINGFAAYLGEEDAMEISKYPGVVSVFPNRGYSLHTTRSWEFLGLERNSETHSAWNKARFGEDVIIANLDSGVWPEHQSFKDDGYGAVPSRWRGICQQGSDQSFSCNRKLIGARYFNKAYRAAAGPLNATFYSPRDYDGHGSHTLSTAAGNFVPGASILGHANGTAKGGSPRARVAAYKVCWPRTFRGECFDADILAAFDAAIHDGVDVLSLSLGGRPSAYFENSLDIGAFHAVKKGITVVCSAGNSGPNNSTVTNVAPWILTVGASTLDRDFPADVVFGNKRVTGKSLSEALTGKKLYPLINSKEANHGNASKEKAELCLPGSLDPAKVKGKIVVCLRGSSAREAKGETVREAGGVGMVLANSGSFGNEIIADVHVLPATHITFSDGLALYSYLNSTKSPLGYIAVHMTKLGAEPAPAMASFSSRGPNTITPGILKPDITAPGVDVLAASTGDVSPTELDFDRRRVAFMLKSGTSMSCPHISGVVGLLKALHPGWSPAAIKSAIMTTARVWDNEKLPLLDEATFLDASPFNYGSGHVRPNRAMDPGLVYDLTTTDYLNFLCGLGYNSTQLAEFRSYSCPSKPPHIKDLNYPSITIPDLSSSTKVTRVVKNVGSPGTYSVRVIEPRGISVTVSPTNLTFDEVGEEKKFEVTLKKIKEGESSAEYVFGRLIWTDRKHYVRTPLVVKSTS
ncbi:subtilisin-like protease SBT5.3 [Musa acuminata AAA Group]|uniref:subtilisin-like protease SBT5.3 n=1 Tax=Musa acuminata AAA Group TaxID=214697 RepID=UPI0031DB7C62